MSTRLAARGRLSRGTFALVVLVSFAVLFAPADDVPAALPGVDKLVHLVLFALLAVTGRWAAVRTPVLAIGLAAYGVLSEVLQALTPLDRSGSLPDLIADLLGIALGLAGWRTGSALRRGAAAGSLGR